MPTVRKTNADSTELDIEDTDGALTDTLPAPLPQRPAGERPLPAGWRQVRFGDVVRNVNVTVEPDESGLERYIAGEHMETDNLHIRKWGTIGDGYLGPAFHRKFVAGQILYGSRRTYLRKVAVADFDGICANTTFVLEPASSDLIPELLPFIMQTESFVKHSIQQSRGSTNPYVTFKDLAWYEFALPPREEQRRIAELLWAADEAYQKEEMAIRSIETAEQVFFDSILQTGLTNLSVKPSKLFGTIPEVWLETPLEDICIRITDGEHATPPRQEEGIYLLSARNVLDGKIDLTVVDYISEETYERLSKRIRPEAGDILISCSGTIGRVCIVPKNIKFALVRSVAILKPGKLVIPKYLEKCLRSKYLQRQISANTSQLAQGNIFQGAIRKLVIPLPPVNQQEEIIDIVNGFDNLKFQLFEQRKITKKLKAQLLFDLLVGQLELSSG